MATYICRADSREIWSVIEESCRKHDAGLCRLDADSGTFNLPIRAKWRNSGNRHYVKFHVSTSPDARKPAHTRLEVTGEFSRASLLRYAFGLSLGVIAAILLLAASLSFMQLPALVLLLGIPLLVVSASGLLSAILHMDSGSRLNVAAIDAIYSDLNATFHTQQVHPHPFLGFHGKNKGLILVFSLTLSLVIAVYIFLGPIASLIACILMGPEVLHNLFMGHRNDWRNSLSEIQLQWTGLSASACGIALLLLVSSGALYVGSQDPDFLKKDNPAIEIQKAAYRFVTDTHGDDRMPRVFAQEVETALHDYVGGTNTRSGNRTHLLILFHLTTSAIFIVIGGLLATNSLYAVFIASEKWNTAVKSRNGRSTLRPPAPVSISNSLTVKMGIVSCFVSSGVLHWIATIISIDIVSYFFVEHALFIRPMGTAMAMFELSSEGSRSWFSQKWTPDPGQGVKWISSGIVGKRRSSDATKTTESRAWI